jgi:hypothetical protein
VIGAEDFTLGDASIVVGAAAGFQVALWYASKALMALGHWKNNRNIARREAMQSVLQITEEA